MRNGLAEFLAISGMIDAVDASITPYKNIEQIPPSHSISYRGRYKAIQDIVLLTAGEEIKTKVK